MMDHPSDYQNREVVILGLARSGRAVAKLFHRMGAIVTVNDRKSKEECSEAEELEDLGIRVICGGHPEHLISDDVALVVKNPGIPYTSPPVVSAMDRGIEVVSEVEVAGKLSQAPIIGITGSNGKTTTTSWISKILLEAGRSPVTAGNIGLPLSEVCETVTEKDVLVAELSSFQLKGTSSFKPHIALLLNVCETHLDYHGTMEDYIASKKKLFANLDSTDWAILNMDDAICSEVAEQLHCHLLPFSTQQELEYGVFTMNSEHGEHLVFRDKKGELFVFCRVSELGIPGRHNLENAAAAAAVALAAGADTDAIRHGLKSFKGVEHRFGMGNAKKRRHFLQQLQGNELHCNNQSTGKLSCSNHPDCWRIGSRS